MPLRSDIKKVLVIGSGPIVIGQAANLTMRERRRAVRLKQRVLRSYL